MDTAKRIHKLLQDQSRSTFGIMDSGISVALALICGGLVLLCCLCCGKNNDKTKKGSKKGVPGWPISDKTLWQVNFEKDPFAQGRFRYAFKGRYTKHPTKCGQSCVVKKFKDSYVWEPKGWDSTLKIYSKAQEYASGFRRGLEFTECELGRVTNVGPSTKVKLDEYTVHEDFLEGDFIKWCNNYGYVSSEARGVDSILTAFMHWSWVRSKGQEMVTDIQGVKNGNRYRLTDPAMISVKREYGVTDTGIEGMAMFFLIHQCSGPCNGLPKPTIAHFVGKIPDSVLQQALAFQQLSARGTTYSHETKFPNVIRNTLVPIFLACARAQ